MTPNTIERIAILDYRIERLQALIESGHRQGLTVRDLEQALSMCAANRAALYADHQGPPIVLDAAPRRSADAGVPNAVREA